VGRQEGGRDVGAEIERLGGLTHAITLAAQMFICPGEAKKWQPLVAPCRSLRGLGDTGCPVLFFFLE
jgi:hypothetical protein